MNSPNPHSCHSNPRWLLLALVGLAALASARAQPFSIDWFKVAGGGAASTGGVYAVSGTAGQADAGAMTGGQFRLVGGFWSLVAAVPAPGAPTLAVTRTETNTVLVCWPSPSTGFVLQQNADLRATNWVSAGQSPSDNGAIKCVTLSPPDGNLFFRLKR